MSDAGSIKASIDFDATGLEAAVNKAMARASRTIGTQIDQGMDKAEGRIKSGFRRTGVLLAGFLGLEAISQKIVQAGTYIATLGRKYEATLNVFQSVSNATATDMEKVSEAAKALGNDITIPGASAADAAVAMTELAKGGLSVQESMDAAQGTLRLAAAAQIEGGQAAEIQAAALNAFGLAADKASMVADVLANGANASAAEIGDMADSLAQAGAVANAAGLSIQETTTFIAQFANAGIKGSDAGTLLKSMLMALRAPSGVAAKEMERLGLSVFDANGKMVDGEEITSRLIAATEGMTEADRAAALGKIFGADAIRGVNILLDQGIAGHRETAKAMAEQGTAAEVAAAKSKGLGGAINGLISIAESLAIEIYEGVAPAMDQWLRGSLDKIPGVLEDAEVYVKALLEALAPAASIIGDFIAAAKPGVVVAFKAALASLLGVVQGLGMILLPVAEAINENEAAFKAIVAPLVAATVAYKAFSAVMSRMRVLRSDVIAGVTKQVDRYKTAMQGATTATSKFRIVGGGMVGALGGPWGLAFAAGTIALGAWARSQAKAKARVEELTGTLDEQTGAVTRSTRKWIANSLAAEGVFEAAKKLGIAYGDVLNAVIDGGPALDGLVGRLKDIRTENREVFATGGQVAVVQTKQSKAAQLLIDTLGDQNSELSKGIEKQRAKIQADKQATAAVKGLEGQTKAQTKAQQAASKAKYDALVRSNRLAKIERVLGGNVKDTTGTLKGQERQARSTTRAIKGLNNAALEGMNAQIDMEQAADDLRKQIKSLTPQVRNSGKALDITTQQGRDTFRAMMDLANASGQVEGGMVRARKQIYDAARALGASKPEAAALTEQFFKLKGAADNVPRSVRVHTSAPGIATTLAQLNALHDKAAAIDGMSVQTYTYEKRILQTLRRASGGAIFGPGTGTSDSVPTMLSHGEHVFTAREVDAAGGHGNILRLRKAILAGAVKFAGGGGLDVPGRPTAPQVSLAALDKARSGDGALVENLAVTVGAQRDLPEALDETLFHLRRIRRGGRYAAE